jgi:hypothetical protein
MISYNLFVFSILSSFNFLFLFFRSSIILYNCSLSDDISTTFDIGFIIYCNVYFYSKLNWVDTDFNFITRLSIFKLNNLLYDKFERFFKYSFN